MRAARWLAGLGLIACSTAAAHAQQAVGFNGSYSGQKTQNVNIDTNRLSTPIPKVPVAKRPFTLGSLVPNFLRRGSAAKGNVMQPPAPTSRP